MSSSYIEELRWRGMLQDMIPGTDEYLAEHKVAGYFGVDPSADSIHIGNLAALMMLVHLQRHGHQPVALVGGATGLVGDPSGKDKERPLQSEEQIRHNVEGIRKQLAHFLDFEAKDNPAIMVNNYDWFKEMSFLDFLRDVGKHITISYMLGKESVKKRMQGDSGLSYTEFAYQLLQGYDFYHLYAHHKVQMQVGGSDQWGNITTGTELVRRKAGHEAEVFAAICPLLTKEDGSKFGKTAGGQTIWLDAARTSPYEFYQYWLNATDVDAEKFIKIFTLKERREIEGLIARHAEAPHLRGLQKALAEDITRRVHGEEGLKSALIQTNFLFSKSMDKQSLVELSASDWKNIARFSDTVQIDRQTLSGGMGILDLLVELGICGSKGEARRSVEKDGSVRLNTEKVETPDQTVSLEDAFHGQYLHVQRGKKNKYIVELTGE